VIDQVVQFFCVCMQTKFTKAPLLNFSNLSENFEQLIVKMIFIFYKRKKITASVQPDEMRINPYFTLAGIEPTSTA
jgi:hypothetical protein